MIGTRNVSLLAETIRYEPDDYDRVMIEGRILIFIKRINGRGDETEQKNYQTGVCHSHSYSKSNLELVGSRPRPRGYIGPSTARHSSYLYVILPADLLPLETS
jgi:hypothetical protein